MFCLGIESTAHTFSSSVVKLDNQSQITILSEIRDIYKPPAGSGIHPREASRHHIEVSSGVVKQSLQKAEIGISDINVISYSAGPGLGPCLRVGAVTARALAAYYRKPIVPVNHALGHIELGIVLTSAVDPLVLLISGGHTMILAFSNKRWRVFGETLDITLGQLLDQFGRKIGLASPCGAVIEELAQNSNEKLYKLPYIIKGNDISLSGLLTASSKLAKSDPRSINDICFSIQETAFSIVAEAVERALSFTGKKELLVVGGVAANKRLANILEKACDRYSVRTKICPINYAGDNGAQIAVPGILSWFFKKQVDIAETFVTQSWRVDSVDVPWRTEIEINSAKSNQEI